MNINTISDFRRAMRAGQYAWPGGYPTYFITADGAALSFAAARQERRQILEAIRDKDSWSGWRVVGVDINYEDGSLYCEHTGERIESAYAEPEELPDDCTKLSICTDCMLFLANGDLPEEPTDWSPDDIAKCWPDHEIVPSCAENCEGSFSWSSCDACGSNLGGDRHDAIAMPHKR